MMCRRFVWQLSDIKALKGQIIFILSFYPFDTIGVSGLGKGEGT
jgi:hypothetical protein